MAKKRHEENGTNGVAVQEPISDTNGNTEAPEAKKRPVTKFGPYAVDKNTNVQVAVWDRQITLPDKREITVYSCTIQCSYFDQTAGEWVNTPFFRGAALPVVSHALMKAYDFILEMRNESRHS